MKKKKTSGIRTPKDKNKRLRFASPSASIYKNDSIIIISGNESKESKQKINKDKEKNNEFKK